MLGTVRHEVRVWSLSGELIGKVIVTLEKRLQQYCSNTATKLGASARNLTLVRLLVVPTHFFKHLTSVSPKGISFCQLGGSVRL